MGSHGTLEQRRQWHRAYRAKPEKRRAELDAQNARRKRERIENPEKARARDRAVYRSRPLNWRKRFRLRKYKITPAEWDTLFLAQGSCCAICKSLDPRTKLTWHTDHDHVTKKVRGILCGDCNRMVGAARDNPDYLIEGAKYLGERLVCSYGG